VNKLRAMGNSMGGGPDVLILAWSLSSHLDVQNFSAKHTDQTRGSLGGLIKLVT
jgi:hypothetical protein